VIQKQRTGPEAGGAVAGIRQPAFFQRQASAADAAFKTPAQALQPRAIGRPHGGAGHRNARSYAP